MTIYYLFARQHNIQRYEIWTCGELLARLPTKSGRKKKVDPADIDIRRLYDTSVGLKNEFTLSNRKRKREMKKKNMNDDHRARLNAYLKLRFQSSRAFIGEKKKCSFCFFFLILFHSLLAL